ncbi:hypothetical protein D3227_04835 [Mesorhizobium waimense]|uniref:Uncharacterized protein n=1 Tax=Mesorhizobium waimense TaxID=1300307 RepID=A0A3A5L344_9HYPH|nr:hypothetical protein [Mesorhizobium waimense]RJT42007.1 hypothetical protein D3227_04835 [Mesorhizobium waimense]
MTKMASLAQKYGDFDKPYGSNTDEYFPSLCLDEKQMDGLDLGKPDIGTEMTMTATVRVSNLSASKNGSRSMSFEIIEAGFEPKEKKPDAASVLFPNG